MSYLHTVHDFKINFPTNIHIVGEQNSGKSYFVIKLLNEISVLANYRPLGVLYFTNKNDENTQMLEKSGVKVKIGIDEDAIGHVLSENLVIFDDVIENSIHFEKLLRLRRYSTSYIIISKNIIKRAFDCSSDIVLMRGVEAQDMEFMSEKLPLRLSYLNDAYKIATSLKYNYLMIMRYATKYSPVLRVNIFYERDMDEKYIKS